jgi:pyruvate kinase
MPEVARKTKIIATPPLRPKEYVSYTFSDSLGQLTGEQAHPSHILELFITAGVDVIRLNMSFGESYDECFEWLRNNRYGIAKEVVALGDLPGPSIGLADVHTIGGSTLKPGDRILLNFGRRITPAGVNRARVLVNGEPFDTQVEEIHGYKDIGAYIRSKDKVIFYLGHGELSVKALSEKLGIVECEVMTGGNIFITQGLLLAAGGLGIPAFGPQDKRALKYLLDQGGNFLKYVAVSFVRSHKDIIEAQDYISNCFVKERKAIANRKPLLLAKIETETAWRNIDRIIEVADGVIIARGELAMELPLHQLPVIQKTIIRKCITQNKSAMVATQVFESMIANSRPTRAEASDIFNAILDGCDGIVLSIETSSGRYPIEAIKMVDQIAREAERFRLEAGTFDGSQERFRVSGHPVLALSRVMPRSHDSSSDELDSLPRSTFYSVFISYGGPDESFAKRLSEALEQAGVYTFLFDRHAEPGKKLHRIMREGVNEYDRVVLVCSRNSLDRAGVLNEIEETLQREAREGGQSILIPITLDDYVFSNWAAERPDLAVAVRDRVVADFRGTKRSKKRFAHAMDRLIGALSRMGKKQRGQPLTRDTVEKKTN